MLIKNEFDPARIQRLLKSAFNKEIGGPKVGQDHARFNSAQINRVFKNNPPFLGRMCRVMKNVPTSHKR